MKQPGVEVAAITQPDGTAEFNEVFFDDARCPKDNVVGGVNNGWVVANTTLAHERGMSATTGYRRFEEEFRLMVDAPANGEIGDPSIRQRLAAYYTKIQILRINGLRSLTAAVQGRKDPGVAALGATNKMFWSEMHRDAMELALDISGAEPCCRRPGPKRESWPGNPRHRAGRPTRSARWCRPSSSPGPRRSGAARPRSSATSSVSGFSACPASPSRRPPVPLRPIASAESAFARPSYRACTLDTVQD